MANSKTVRHAEDLVWNADGLIPVIAQEAETGMVLMMAWMNREALDATLKTRIMHYWSRSRNELWRKGATSGHEQKLIELKADCDGDTLLATVVQTGAACHTGSKNCFFNPLLPSAGDKA